MDIKKLFRRLLDRLFQPYFDNYALQSLRELARVDKGVQTLLMLKYRELASSFSPSPIVGSESEGKRDLPPSPAVGKASGGEGDLFPSPMIGRGAGGEGHFSPLPALQDVGFSAYSQNEEDGILLYIFSLLGTTNRKSVEICAGDGIECNTANLIINHGWRGLLVDGDEANVQRGREFYARCPKTWVFPPAFVHAWVEMENVNELITSNGFQGEIDLLSIDLDGNDYWIWKAIDSIQPRVVVIECHNIWPADKAVTIPYKRDFNKFDLHPDYSGASLGALVKLGKAKGYRLVGCNHYGFNAFFIRNGIGENFFPEVSAEQCLDVPHAILARQTRLPQVIRYEWVEV
jgi:hypothetical protein